MPTRFEICDDCPDSTEIKEGEIACRFIGVWVRDGDGRKFVVSCCALKKLMMNPSATCQHPTEDRWKDAMLPVLQPPASASVSVSTSNSLPKAVSDALTERNIKCHRCPHFEKGYFCRYAGKSVKQLIVDLTADGPGPPELCWSTTRPQGAETQVKNRETQQRK